MRSALALGLLAAVSLSTAQDNYQIDPSTVDDFLKEAWCKDQKASCPLICTQQENVTSTTTIANDCEPDNLQYSCVCENGLSPNLTQYSLTIPYHICQTKGTQCAEACNGVNTCEDACRADHPCGAQDPPKATATPSTSGASTAAPTGTDAASTSIPVDGFGGPQSTDTANDNTGAASAMLNLGASYGMAVVFASVFAAFTVLL